MAIEEFVNNELEPLKQWYCDSCGEIIKSPDNGWVEWYQDYVGEYGHGKDKGFRIVHRDKKCMYDSSRMHLQDKGVSDMHLNDFVGPDGLLNLLIFIDYNRAEDNSEVIEIIKRLHLPYYEEARKYHKVAEENGFFDGENELTRSLTSSSKYILNQYKR